MRLGTDELNKTAKKSNCNFLGVEDYRIIEEMCSQDQMIKKEDELSIHILGDVNVRGKYFYPFRVEFKYMGKWYHFYIEAIIARDNWSTPFSYGSSPGYDYKAMESEFIRIIKMFIKNKKGTLSK